MLRRRRWILISLVLLIVFSIGYIRTNPLVFMDTHRHCIKYAGMQLDEYASSHLDRYPFHSGGYTQALLLLDESSFYSLTGPGYSDTPFHEAKQTGETLSEEDCGRIYIQGLTKKSNPKLAILFDKLPTPGGDHCPLPNRLWASLGREVLLVGGGHVFVGESGWPEFAKKQVELLIREGFDKQIAERLFAIQSR